MSVAIYIAIIAIIISIIALVIVIIQIPGEEGPAIYIAIIAIIISIIVLVIVIIQIPGEEGPAGVTVPIGTVLSYAGSIAPTNFMIANGTEISRTTFSALFDIIGTTYGAGDGSTTFNLPDLRDTFIRGTSANPGGTGGTASHSHSVDPSSISTSSDTHAHKWSKYTGDDSRNFKTFNDNGVEFTMINFPNDRSLKFDKKGNLIAIGRIGGGGNSNVHFFTDTDNHRHTVNIGPTTSTTTGNEPPFLSLVHTLKETHILRDRHTH